MGRETIWFDQTTSGLLTLALLRDIYLENPFLWVTIQSPIGPLLVILAEFYPLGFDSISGTYAKNTKLQLLPSIHR